MKLGFARVSTSEQVLDLQLDALRQAGCDDIYTNTVSGVQAYQPNWEQLLAYARPGDTVVIWRLDRLGRSPKHLISLQDPIDTTSPGGLQAAPSRPGGRPLYKILRVAGCAIATARAVGPTFFAHA